MEKKSNRMSIFNIVTYICICTIGSTVLVGAHDLRSRALNNVILINGIMVLTYVILLCFSMCYAELKEIVPEEGGDMVYSGKFYASFLGTAYALSILLLTAPGVNTIFMMYIKGAYGLADKYNVFYFGAMCLIVPSLCLLPISLKARVVNILGTLQKIMLLGIDISLPLALFLKNKNPLISTTGVVKQEGVTADSFFRTLSEVYFSYCGYTEANSFTREQTGPLFKPYICSTTVIYAIYAVIVNLFLGVYKNDPSEIKFENVLGFMGGAARPIYLIIATVMYSLPFFGLSFMTANNIQYICKKHCVHESLKYVFVCLISLINFALTFVGLGVVMNIVCANMIFFAMLSIAGIIVHKYRNPKYQPKVPMPLVYGSVGIAATMFGINITYIIKK